MDTEKALEIIEWEGNELVENYRRMLRNGCGDDVPELVFIEKEIKRRLLLKK